MRGPGLERARPAGYRVGFHATPTPDETVRATTLLKKCLGIKCTRVERVKFEEEGLVCDVRPTTRRARCSGCGCRARRVYDRRTKPRRWRHLDIGGMKVWLRYTLRRVECRRCNVTTEMVPWAAPDSWFTEAFEQTAAFLAQAAAKTVVATMMRVAWPTVGSIVRRVVARMVPGDPLDGLLDIGVDELSYRRHHEYVTIVTDHTTGRVVWAHPGKNADTLLKFFAELGAERCARLRTVTIDMSKAYIAAVKQAAPHAKIVFDRFHVQRLVHDALDEVRRAEVREAHDPEQRRTLKKTRFALQKNPWNLTDIEHTKLATVQRSNRRLYRAYLRSRGDRARKAVLDRNQPNVAQSKLSEWAASVGRRAPSRAAVLRRRRAPSRSTWLESSSTSGQACPTAGAKASMARYEASPVAPSAFTMLGASSA